MCQVEIDPSSRQHWVGQLLKAAGLMRSRMRRLLKMVAAVFGDLPFIIPRFENYTISPNSTQEQRSELVYLTLNM